MPEVLETKKDNKLSDVMKPTQGYHTLHNNLRQKKDKEMAYVDILHSMMRQVKVDYPGIKDEILQAVTLED